MSKNKYLIFTILLFITYGVGLPLFIVGIINNFEQPLFVIIGFILCGLAAGIVLFVLGPTSTFIIIPARSVRSTRIAFGILGLFLGLAITPILIVVLIVKTVKAKSSYVSSPIGPITEEEELQRRAFEKAITDSSDDEFTEKETWSMLDDEFLD